MTDDAVMRAELQRVAAYRELCAGVRRSGRHNAVFAAIMLALAAAVAENGGGPQVYLYAGLALAELLIGLYKWLVPSAEGVLLDGAVLVLFAGWNLAGQAMQFAAGQPGRNFGLFLGLFFLWASVGRFRAYAQLRQLFADRPTRDQLLWFDDLAAEIRRSHPEADPTALDLPTRPRWKGKLLGATAFLVAAKGESAVVAGPWDIDITSTKSARRRDPRVVLWLYGQPSSPFEIDAASLDNFRSWAAAVRGEPAGPR